MKLLELKGTTIKGMAAKSSGELNSRETSFALALPGLMSSKVPVQSEGMMRSTVGHGYT